MCANNDRPLLGLVTLMAAETNFNAACLMPLQRGQPPLPLIQCHVFPRQAVHGVYLFGRRGEDFVRPFHKKNNPTLETAKERGHPDPKIELIPVLPTTSPTISGDALLLGFLRQRAIASQLLMHA